MKIKVLMFGWEFPPHNSGGLGTACFGLSKALSKQAEIAFVLPRKLKGVADDFVKITSPDIPYASLYAFDSPLSPYLNENTYGLDSSNPGVVYGRNIFEEVARYAFYGGLIAKREKFNVIHAHDWLSFGAGIRAKEESGKPFVAHVHATEFDRGGGESIDQRVYKIEKEGMEKANKVVAVSNFTKNIITRHYGISPQKVEVVHNGIEYTEGEKLSSLHKIKKSGNKIVLFVGRITLQKGPDYFVRTAKRVCQATDNVFFVVSGSGDMEQQIMREAARLGISDKVLFTGFLRGKKLRNMYKMADLFVMPSVSEPFGLTPLESLINGTPVLISKQSGVSEVLSHALKVDFWDIEETANKILCALHYDSLSSCLCKEGKKEAKNVTWESAAEKCMRIYESAINN